MEKKELEAIIDELVDAGPVLKLAIKTYEAMPDSDSKRLLASAITDVQQELTRLDVMLEDLQLDLETVQVEKELDNMNNDCYN